MKTRMHGIAVSMMVGASLALVLWPGAQAHAWVGDGSYASPPTGWDHLCTPQAISMSPRPSSRLYSATATCWINLSADKTSEDSGKSQQWVQVPVSMKGQYNLSAQSFHEAITVNMQGGARTITVNGTACTDDPWATQAKCSTDYSRAWTAVSVNFGWTFTYGGAGTDALRNGPFSRAIFDPSLVQAQLKKMESSPPSAPAGVAAVLWPAQNGRDAIANVSWHAGDMSNNKWVLRFDVEYSQFADGTFTGAGQRVGPGPKQNMSAADANRVYVLTSTAALHSGNTYYFRVCAMNDAGRLCSPAVQTRAPTTMEKAEHASGMHVALGGMTPLGGNRPGGGGANPTGGPIALGTARPGFGSPTGGSRGGGAPSGGSHRTPLGTSRPIGPIALGGAHPAGGSNGSGGSGGSGGLTPAGTPPTSIGGNRPGAHPRGGVPGIAMHRPIGPVARMTPHGGTGPGTVAFPDLALGRGMFVRGRFVPWGGGFRLALRADATHTCPVQMSFRFHNAGKGPAQNVTAALRDSQNPMVPVATETLPAMAAGQSSSVGGVLKVAAAPAARRLILAARVHEAGKIHEKNVANDHGSVTLNVTCK